jgi:hypothetical protein
MTPDSEAAGQWRWQVMAQASFPYATFGEIGTADVVPLWPGYPILGRVQPGQVLAIGDGIKQVQGIPMASPIIVMPGNLFWMFLTLAVLDAEGGFIVHEFQQEDEDSWNVGSVR